MISIHAPRGGSDLGGGRIVQPPCYFNPRSPRGERRLHGRSQVFHLLFQSTLPAGGATLSVLPVVVPVMVFQSTLPAGGATHVYWRLED